MVHSDVVFLVPGFLGFERFGNFGNFAERVTSALRASLEDKIGWAVPVIAVPSLPTASLAERQKVLLRTLVNRFAALGGAERIHLVGHSTGGVDAHLLSCVRPLEGGSWASLGPGQPEELVSKIRSVTSIGSPHRGTYLASGEGTRALTPRGMLQNPAGARAILELLSLLVSSAWADVDARDFAYAAAREGRKVSHFVAELLRWQGLLRALTPDAMEALYRRAEPIAGVRRRSFVTVAGKPVEGAESSGPDAFFEELSRRAAGANQTFSRQGPEMRACLDRLRAAAADPARLIISPSATLPTRIDGGTNDGVVNSARQLIAPRDHDELVCVVVADHFDVLGYYNRSVWIHDRDGKDHARDVVSGLLHSGSHFRDAEFFALYRRVAEVIAEVAAVQPGRDAQPEAARGAAVTALRRPRSRRPAAS